jgi:hypothetical protein
VRTWPADDRTYEVASTVFGRVVLYFCTSFFRPAGRKNDVLKMEGARAISAGYGHFQVLTA